MRTGVTDDNVAHKMTPSERHRGSSQSHSFTFRPTKLLQCRTEPLKIIKPQKMQRINLIYNVPSVMAHYILDYRWYIKIVVTHATVLFFLRFSPLLGSC